MKLLYLFFCQLMLLEMVYTQNGTTTLQPPLTRLLSRKKRFLLMPKGCHLKFTGQLSKRLIAEFPRGFNFVIEMALYYPAVTAIQDAIPKRLRKPTTTTPKPKGTKPPIFVCVPGSLLCWKAKPAIKPKPMKLQRIDENAGNIKWIEPQGYQKYADPQQWSKWSKYGDPQQYERYKWSPANAAKHSPLQYYLPNYTPSWSKWTTTTQPTPAMRRQWYKPVNTTAYHQWTNPRVQQYQHQIRRQRWRRTLRRAYSYLPDKHFINVEDNDDPLSSSRLMHFEDLEPHLEWSHYHSHRDRRQLFHQFEGLSSLLGFDMKSCMLRAICESKRYLLPTGYSLIHDILRVVFTLPTTSGLEDDYSQAMRADFETCDKFIKPKCAFNILDWFLNPEKGL